MLPLVTFVLSIPGYFSLGRVHLPAYGVIAAFGLLLALLLSQHTAKLAGLSADQLWDAGVFAILAAFVTSRALLVAFNFRSFLSYPLLVLSLPSLTYTGMLLAGTAVAVYFRFKRIPWRNAPRRRRAVVLGGAAAALAAALLFPDRRERAAAAAAREAAAAIGPGELAAIRALRFAFFADIEAGAPAVNPERPFGSTDPLGDLARLTGVRGDAAARRMFARVMGRLPAFCGRALLEPGTYGVDGRPVTVSAEQVRLLPHLAWQTPGEDDDMQPEDGAWPVAHVDFSRPYGRRSLFEADMAEALGLAVERTAAGYVEVGGRGAGADAGGASDDGRRAAGGGGAWAVAGRGVRSGPPWTVHHDSHCKPPIARAAALDCFALPATAICSRAIGPTPSWPGLTRPPPRERRCRQARVGADRAPSRTAAAPRGWRVESGHDGDPKDCRRTIRKILTSAHSGVAILGHLAYKATPSVFTPFKRTTPLLSGRFRNLLRFLNGALLALVEHGHDVANAAVAAIQATAAVRLERLSRLMDRFEAGTLRTRAAAVRRSAPRAPVVRAAPLWPAHKAGWMNIVGFNHPSHIVRVRWAHGSSIRLPARVHLADYASGVRTLVEEDAVMRGLLEASGEARRMVRWLLRGASDAKLPAILKEPPRARAPRPLEPRAPRPRDPQVPRPWGPRVPRARRVPAPFEAPPASLMRDEREQRGMYVPPALQFTDFASVEFIPTADQIRDDDDRTVEGTDSARAYRYDIKPFDRVQPLPPSLPQRQVASCGLVDADAEGGLGGGEAGDGDAVGAARDVVQPDRLAERDRGRVAAVLAADAHLEPRPGLARPLLRGHDAPARRPRRCRSRRTGPSAGCPPPRSAAGTCRRRRATGRTPSASGRWCRTLKKSAASAIRSAVSAARGSSIMVPTRYSMEAAGLRERRPSPRLSTWARVMSSSRLVPTSGIMISGTTGAAGRRGRWRPCAASKMARACIS